MTTITNVYDYIAHTVTTAGILSLLQCIGEAYASLTQYECRRAIELFQALPQHQMATGWVMAMVGRALFELQQYHEVGWGEACRFIA